MSSLEATTGDGATTKGKGSRKRSQSSTNAIANANANSAFDLMPETDYGLCPQSRNVGVGWLERRDVFFGRFRKALCLYFDALLKMGNSEVLGAAVQFLDASKNNKDYEWLSRPGFEDIRQLAKGYYLLSMLSSALSLCSLESLLPQEHVSIADGDVASPGLSKGGFSRKRGGADAEVVAQGRREQRHLRGLSARLDPSVAERVLEKIFTLYIDNAVVSQQREQLQWDPSMVIIPARAALDLSETLAPQGTSSSLPYAGALTALVHSNTLQSIFKTYARLYLHLLATTAASDKLKSILLNLKRKSASSNNNIASSKTGGSKVANAPSSSLSAVDKSVVDKVLPPMVKAVCSALVEALRNECNEVIEESKRLMPELKNGVEIASGAVSSAAAGSGVPKEIQPPLSTIQPQQQQYQENISRPSGPGFIALVDLTTSQPTLGASSSAAAPAATAPIQVPVLPPRPPATLTPEQMVPLRQVAYMASQQQTAAAVIQLQAQGQVVTPALVQLLQERQFTACLNELVERHQQKMKSEYQQAVLRAQMEAQRVAHAQAQQEAQQQQALTKIGLVPTTPLTPTEQDVQDKVFTKMFRVTSTMKQASWITDNPVFKDVVAAADGLRIELLKCYLALGHIQPFARPTERAQALKLCDDVVRLHRGKTSRDKGGDGASGSGQGGGKKQKVVASGPGVTNNQPGTGGA